VSTFAHCLVEMPVTVGTDAPSSRSLSPSLSQHKPERTQPESTETRQPSTPTYTRSAGPVSYAGNPEGATAALATVYGNYITADLDTVVTYPPARSGRQKITWTDNKGNEKRAWYNPYWERDMERKRGGSSLTGSGR